MGLAVRSGASLRTFSIRTGTIVRSADRTAGAQARTGAGTDAETETKTYFGVGEKV